MKKSSYELRAKRSKFKRSWWHRKTPNYIRSSCIQYCRTLKTQNNLLNNIKLMGNISLQRWVQVKVIGNLWSNSFKLPKCRFDLPPHTLKLFRTMKIILYYTFQYCFLGTKREGNMFAFFVKNLPGLLSSRSKNSQSKDFPTCVGISHIFLLERHSIFRSPKQ